MEVKKLKAILKDLPDHMEVVMKVETDTFDISTIESAKVKNVRFSEEGGTGPVAYEDCLVLSDDID